MTKKIRFFAVSESPKDDNCWTVSTSPNVCGWETDSGSPKYGLPKKMAEWIVDTLNDSPNTPPFRIGHLRNDWIEVK